LRAIGQNLQQRLAGFPTATVVWLLTYLNTAAMGNYDEALALGAATHTVPDIVATDQPGRRKHRFGLAVEQALGLERRQGGKLRVHHYRLQRIRPCASAIDSNTSIPSKDQPCVAALETSSSRVSDNVT